MSSFKLPQIERTCGVQIRLTEYERVALQIAAVKCGRSMSAYIRAVTFGVEDPVTDPIMAMARRQVDAAKEAEDET